MEHLTKQQILLLTLFVSFVTSIATGIVTVSLMDQAPIGVTGTVERVIERTVDEVAPSSTDANSSATQGTASAANGAASASQTVNPLNAVANATAIAEQSLVRIELANGTNGINGMNETIGTAGSDSPTVTGLGVIVSKNGLVMADKSAVAELGNYRGVLSDGHSFAIQILQSQNNGDIVFLLMQIETVVSSSTGASSSASSAISSPSETFVPVTFANSAGTDHPELGQTVIALSGTDTPTVSEGIIQKIETNASSTPTTYSTSIDPTETLVGSPLFDLSGEIIGIKTSSLKSQNDTYYPTAPLKAAIPIILQTQ